MRTAGDMNVLDRVLDGESRRYERRERIVSS
jgi:hypothetical protein